MPVPNGEAPTAEGPVVGEAGDNDVTIKIRGQTAARILLRGETEARELKEMAGKLSRRLDGLEEAAARRMTEQVRLGQLVQGLQDKVTQLGGQVAQLREQATAQGTQLHAQVGRVGEEQGYKLRHLQTKVEQLQQHVEGLAQAMQTLAPAPLPTEPRTAGASEAGHPQATPPDASGWLDRDRWAERFKRLNLSLGL